LLFIQTNHQAIAISMATLLSVNLNKIALLRNSRGGSTPDLLHFARLAIEHGAKGLTVHPRADQRHIRLDDVVALSTLPQIQSGEIEFNIEGDLRPELIRMSEVIKPTQFTVVPVMPNEITSDRGWRAYDQHDLLRDTVDRLSKNTRVAVFCDPDPVSVELAAEGGVQAIEIFTGPYANAFGTSGCEDRLGDIKAATDRAQELGLRLNGGHDLTVENLPKLLAAIPFHELSIGHHLTSMAVELGWANAVRAYANVCA
jgi:pyridoxine 5-phosphate synthase